MTFDFPEFLSELFITLVESENVPEATNETKPTQAQVSAEWLSPTVIKLLSFPVVNEVNDCWHGMLSTRPSGLVTTTSDHTYTYDHQNHHPQPTLTFTFYTCHISTLLVTLLSFIIMSCISINYYPGRCCKVYYHLIENNVWIIVHTNNE